MAIIADHILRPYPLPVRPFDFGDFPAPARDVLAARPYAARWQVYGNRAAGLRGFDTGDINLGNIDIGGTVQGILDNGWNALTGAINNAIATKSGSVADPVPVQNQTTQKVLAPVSNALQMSQVVASGTALRALQAFLDKAHQTWLDFLNQNWSSRAEGAFNTLEPYFRGLSETIQADIAKLDAAGNSGYIPGTDIPLPGGIGDTISQHPIATSTLILGAVAAYFLLRK